jgi:UDP-N-acetylmuramate: L-alanyl-gamma-D-glutamyl-meso-diaminopimelate ligase
MLAWILEDSGLNPGFLVGGVPANFGLSARLGQSPFFVVEADEYDTAFFDKRSKFVHYHPRTLILNNLEYDHADIFPDLAAIQRQVHHLVRTVPGNGLIVSRAGDATLEETLAMGCWTPVEGVSTSGTDAAWGARRKNEDGSVFEVLLAGEIAGTVNWSQIGDHNMHNALAAIAAARHAGVPVVAAIKALGRYKGVKRRMEVRGRVAGVTVYDDFAHHPTAIATTLQGLRNRVGQQRILALLEPRSNTMRMGVHRDSLAASLAQADEVWLYAPPGLDWDPRPVVAGMGAPVRVQDSIDRIVDDVVQASGHGDHVLVMSNGAFGGIHQRLLDRLGELGVRSEE